MFETTYIIPNAVANIRYGVHTVIEKETYMVRSAWWILLERIIVIHIYIYIPWVSSRWT